MKVRVDIPLDLRLHSNSVFRITKQVADPTGRTSWETVYLIEAGSGAYLADLEPGQYQKILETISGPLAVSNTFEITQDGRYIDEVGNVFTIAEDGALHKVK
ncbi:MAG TPA: hypothetical protein VKR06_18215 [Ktedonosporobacter sp.]|nr:hypothetical protein [Ktedonosporobacter sp.]